MKTEYYTCKKCKRRYEYNADVGYSRDNICGPFCDGILRGEEKSAARISALEAERDRAVELLRTECLCYEFSAACTRCKQKHAFLASIGGEGE